MILIVITVTNGQVFTQSVIWLFCFSIVVATWATLFKKKLETKRKIKIVALIFCVAHLVPIMIVSSQLKTSYQNQKTFNRARIDISESWRQVNEDSTADSKKVVPILPKNDAGVEIGEPGPFVSCECKILEYDPQFLFCDNDLVPEGSMSSMGEYPWMLIELVTPNVIKGREVSIVFKSSSFKNESGSTSDFIGKACTLKLPRNFLEGEYRLIMGWSVEDFVVRETTRTQRTVER